MIKILEINTERNGPQYTEVAEMTYITLEITTRDGHKERYHLRQDDRGTLNLIGDSDALRHTRLHVMPQSGNAINLKMGE